MDRPVTDDDILTFLRVNKQRYASQIELLQAAARLLWPSGPPTAAGERLARLALQEAHSHTPRPDRPTTGPFVQTSPLV